MIATTLTILALGAATSVLIGLVVLLARKTQPTHNHKPTENEMSPINTAGPQREFNRDARVSHSDFGPGTVFYAGRNQMGLVAVRFDCDTGKVDPTYVHANNLRRYADLRRTVKEPTLVARHEKAKQGGDRGLPRLAIGRFGYHKPNGRTVRITHVGSVTYGVEWPDLKWGSVPHEDVESLSFDVEREAVVVWGSVTDANNHQFDEIRQSARDLIENERNMQDDKWGRQLDQSPSQLMMILQEELGEWAHDVLERKAPESFIELVQCAAVMQKMVETAIHQKWGEELP